METKEFIKNNSAKLHNAFDKKSILLAGSTGVVGTAYLNFFSTLMSLGTEVKLDCITYSGNILLEYLNQKDIKFIKGDVTDTGFTNSLDQYDLVIHSAGYGQPAKFTSNPISALKTNTLGTLNLIEKVYPGGKFVYFSSSEVYADLTGKNFLESQIGTSTPEHPRAAYIEGKRAGEAIVNTHKFNSDIQTYIFRLALAHGPGANSTDERVLNTFVRAALDKKLIEMKDQGRAVRTYCSSQDAINLTMGVLLNENQGTHNLGGVSRITIRELAEKIGTMIGARVILPNNQEEYLKFAPSEVSLNLDKLLMSNPNYSFDSLENALSLTIRWFEGISKSSTNIYTTIQS